MRLPCGRVEHADNLLPALSAFFIRRLNRRITNAASDFVFRLRNNPPSKYGKVSPLRGLAFRRDITSSDKALKRLTAPQADSGELGQ